VRIWLSSQTFTFDSVEKKVEFSKKYKSPACREREKMFRANSHGFTIIDWGVTLYLYRSFSVENWISRVRDVFELKHLYHAKGPVVKTLFEKLIAAAETHFNDADVSKLEKKLDRLAREHGVLDWPTVGMPISVTDPDGRSSTLCCDNLQFSLGHSQHPDQWLRTVRTSLLERPQEYVPVVLKEVGRIGNEVWSSTRRSRQRSGDELSVLMDGLNILRQEHGMLLPIC